MIRPSLASDFNVVGRLHRLSYFIITSDLQSGNVNCVLLDSLQPSAAFLKPHWRCQDVEEKERTGAQLHVRPMQVVGPVSVPVHPGPLLRTRSPPPPRTHLSTTMNALSRREEDTVVKTAKGRALKLCDPVVKGA